MTNNDSAINKIHAVLDALWNGEAPDGEQVEIYVIETLKSVAAEMGTPWIPTTIEGVHATVQ